MSELIDMDKTGEGQGQDIKNICFAMIEIMVAKSPELKPWKIHSNPNHTTFDVDMKIDGVSVKFSTIIKHLFDQYEQQMEKAVIERIGEMFDKLQIENNNVLDQLKTKYGVY